MDGPRLTKIKHVLVTGGVGFIGSHTVVELLQCGCRVTIVDNFCNSKPECLERIQEIAKSTNINFFEVICAAAHLGCLNTQPCICISVSNLTYQFTNMQLAFRWILATPKRWKKCSSHLANLTLVSILQR